MESQPQNPEFRINPENLDPTGFSNLEKSVSFAVKYTCTSALLLSII